MSEPFLGEIKLASFNFPPRGWALCNGQLLPINQNQALFALLGTMYGGDGRTNFALPNLQGRVPIHIGGGFQQGQVLGAEFQTLNVNELPQHSHIGQARAARAALVGGAVPKAGATLAQGTTATNPQRDVNLYGAGAPNIAMAATAIGNAGGSQPHENRQPFLALTHIIALQGIFPSQN